MSATDGVSNGAALNLAADLINSYMGWTATDEGGEYWSTVFGKLQEKAEAMKKADPALYAKQEKRLKESCGGAVQDTQGVKPATPKSFPEEIAARLAALKG